VSGEKREEREEKDLRWLRRHAMAAPFGVVITTGLLLARSGTWEGWESLESAAILVDLGAAVYGMAAVIAERGVRMVFWALDQRRKWREKWAKEAEDRGQAKERARIVQAAKEAGIDISGLIPEEEESK